MTELIRKFRVVGVRVLTEDQNTNVGEVLRNSYDWDYEEDVTSFGNSGNELNGSCAITVCEDMASFDDEEILEALEIAKEKASNYSGGKMVLIGGDCCEYGADEGEIIIENAKVIAFL